ncbi:hypothetical protein K440DRAFT_663994 [Wilcoxina mikolae CBS 423.85]|nr:hypothetical protein K440DRAFT_663994 [Wilcoxina mikolae CBS 423.85]
MRGYKTDAVAAGKVHDGTQMVPQDYSDDELPEHTTQLCDMPNELLDQIIEFLPLKSLLSFANTNLRIRKCVHKQILHRFRLPTTPLVNPKDIDLDALWPSNIDPYGPSEEDLRMLLGHSVPLFSSILRPHPPKQWWIYEEGFTLEDLDGQEDEPWWAYNMIDRNDHPRIFGQALMNRSLKDKLLFLIHNNRRPLFDVVELIEHGDIPAIKALAAKGHVYITEKVLVAAMTKELGYVKNEKGKWVTAQNRGSRVLGLLEAVLDGAPAATVAAVGITLLQFGNISVWEWLGGLDVNCSEVARVVKTLLKAVDGAEDVCAEWIICGWRIADEEAIKSILEMRNRRQFVLEAFWESKSVTMEASGAINWGKTFISRSFIGSNQNPGGTARTSLSRFVYSLIVRQLRYLGFVFLDETGVSPTDEKC